MIKGLFIITFRYANVKIRDLFSDRQPTGGSNALFSHGKTLKGYPLQPQCRQGAAAVPSPVILNLIGISLFPYIPGVIPCPISPRLKGEESCGKFMLNLCNNL